MYHITNYITINQFYQLTFTGDETSVPGARGGGLQAGRELLDHPPAVQLRGARSSQGQVPR